MAYWMTWLRSKAYHEAGQGLVEYALIILFIAIALTGVLTLMGGEVGSPFSRIASTLIAATP